MKQNRSVLLFSGGVDSTLALHWALEEGRDVHVLEIDYPQRPIGEERAAKKILGRLKAAGRHRIEIPFLKPIGGPDGYLPTRNLVYHAIAQSLAETIGARSVIAGHLREDAEGFPDAEPAFFSELQGLAARGRPKRSDIRIENPLQRAGIEEIARGLPIPLDWTWSCWIQGTKPCARCEKCVRRADLLRRLNPPKQTAWFARTSKVNRGQRGSRASRR